jgi:shikimate dehydrogenase
MLRSEKIMLGVIGNPISHSKSPLIQMAAIRHLNLDATYDALELPTEDFTFEIELRKLLASMYGFNVTLPFKEKVLKYLNRIDDLAKRISAVNTVRINRGGLLEGFNTDYYGFKESLKEFDLFEKRVAIIGAGGAAKAVIAALDDLKVSNIDIFVRNAERARDSIPRIEHAEFKIELFGQDTSLENYDLLINATPIGQGRLSNELPVTVEHLKQLNQGAIAYDLIYEDTLFLKEARKLKHNTVNGSEMLILQAAKSLEIWTGCVIDEALVKVMREAFHKNDLNHQVKV